MYKSLHAVESFLTVKSRRRADIINLILVRRKAIWSI